MSGEIQFNTEVESILTEPRKPLGIPGEPYFWQDSRAAGVKTNRGEIKAKKTIGAAGAWTGPLLDSVGLDVHIKPKKRQLFSVRANTDALKKLLRSRGFNQEGCIPFTILPKPRVYLKPALEEDAFWFAYGDDFPREFKLEDEPQPEENYYQYGIYQVAIKYFPQFADCQPFTSWAGQYAMNTLDGQPVICEENDLLVVSGASGSGNMKADAVGRIAASLWAGEKEARLYGDKKFRVRDLSISHRKVEPEKLII
jgi:glycine/D-amino acid oxidase-like deaminating enzyme